MSISRAPPCRRRRTRAATATPHFNVRFAVKALGKLPRRKPNDQRFTQYNLDWADEVREYLDRLGNPGSPAIGRILDVVVGIDEEVTHASTGFHS